MRFARHKFSADRHLTLFCTPACLFGGQSSFGEQILGKVDGEQTYLILFSTLMNFREASCKIPVSVNSGCWYGMSHSEFMERENAVVQVKSPCTTNLGAHSFNSIAEMISFAEIDMAHKIRRWIERVEEVFDSQSEVPPLSASDTKAILTKGVNRLQTSPLVQLRHLTYLSIINGPQKGTSESNRFHFVLVD